VQIEGGRGARVAAAEFGMAAIADGEVFEPAVDNEIDEGRGGQQAVRDYVAAKPVEHRADGRAGDDDREPDLGIEVLSRVEVRALTHRTRVDARIVTNGLADRQLDVAAASPAADRRGCLSGIDRQAGVACRTLREYVHAQLSALIITMSRRHEALDS
jgi:hypothetical protein